MAVPFEQRCGCADCEAAVSPAAYLAALLDYVLKHLRKNSKDKIDLQLLVDTFFQPFTDLPADCEAVEKQVRQVRICIEVLRSYLGKRPLADPATEEALVKGEKDYVFSAYTMLLNRIGTSYEEIRRMRAEIPENRTALAERLGIALTEPRPPDLPNNEEQNGDELDQLFLETGAEPPKDHLLTEQALEMRFGLADTTRDPLSEGAKLGNDQGQITRWNLNGVVWGQNTDRNGWVHVKLINPATAVFRVELYQDASRTTLVASGERATASGTVKVVPENNSGLYGLFEIAYTAYNAACSISAVPALLSWQLRHLRAVWAKQDHPVDTYSDGASPELPIIDPDLVGPDDFRTPTQKPNAADPDRAFDMWLKRRAFIDTTLSGLKTDREAKGLTAILQQVLGNPLPDLEGSLLTITKGGPAKEIETAKDTLTALALTIESFTRLMAIRSKYRLAQSDPRNEKVSPEEWNELYSILAQVAKVKQFAAWLAEEKSAGITLGLKEFWFSVREPQEGDWPVASLADRPMIDPGIVKVNDLPEWLAGKQAISLWNGRKARLEQIPKELQAERETKGFEAMMRLAIGHPTPGSPLQHDLQTIKTNLSRPDDTVRENAIKQIEDDLHLTVESFKRLMGIKAANDQPDPVKKPTAAQWAEVYAILTGGRKVKHEYPRWAEEEKTAGVIYWKALKAKLPRWRASLESRRAWQQALRTRSQRPIIDPTVMGADDLQHKIPGDLAFDVWKERSDRLTVVRDGLKKSLKTSLESDPHTLTGVGKIIKEALGVDLTDLEALDLERQGGHSVERRLEQLNLVSGAFTYVMRIIGLAKATQPITDPEWEILYATLAQAEIQLEFAAFRAEEHDKGISLAPDFFKLPKALLTPLPFVEPFTPLWLSTRQARSDWQDRLQSRIDQESSVAEGLRTAISAVEEVTLPLLRDAMIQALEAVGASLAEQAEWITARLLIDAKSGGCRITTRVAQALETLQSLVFTLRSGQFKQLDTFTLSLVSDCFDEEWKWIGSYATWRSAMFVFLYPENILQPGLLKYKTPTFDTFLANTRAFSLSPDKACQEANRYADYFKDICSLDIQATCQARTRMHSPNNCRPNDIVERDLFYMFGRAPSGKVYWSTYDPQNASGYAQSFWTYLDCFENLTVIRIIGAMPYIRRGHISYQDYKGGGKWADSGDAPVISAHICLFCLVEDKARQTKLVFIKLDLERKGLVGDWDQVPTDLQVDLPGKRDSLNIVPVQTSGDSVSPQLAFHVPGNTRGIYLRSIDFTTNTWERSEIGWEDYFVPVNDLVGGGPTFSTVGVFRELHAVLMINDSRWVIFTNSNRHLRVIQQPLGDRLNWKPLNWPQEESSFLGALPGKSYFTEGKIRFLAESSIYVFFSTNNRPTYRQVKKISIGQPFSTIADLNWIVPHSGSARDGQQAFAYQRNRKSNAFYYFRYREAKDRLNGNSTFRAAPRVNVPKDIPGHLSSAQLDRRRQDIKAAFALNDDVTPSILAYLQEAYCFVPLHLACALTTAGHHMAALDWFRTLYDYEAELGPTNKRLIYYGLEIDAKIPDVPLYQQADGWLLDPLNPHLIASTRRYAVTRFTLMCLVRCLLAFADSEFTQEAGESLTKARTLYITALDLLHLPELQQKLSICDDLIAELQIKPGNDDPSEVPAAVGEIMEELSILAPKIEGFPKVIKELKSKLEGTASWNTRLTDARAVLRAALVGAPILPTTGSIVIGTATTLKEKHAFLISDSTVDNALQGVSKGVAEKFFDGLEKGNPQISLPDIAEIASVAPPPSSLVTAPSLKFCIPPNPVLKALRLHAELNLYKLRTCRNIAGMNRQLESYAAATDATTGLPAIGASGQLVLPGVARLQPTLYRYATLMERTKQLVQLAAQIEGAMQSTLERLDMEAQTMLQARQQLNLAQAGVRLQDLRVSEANKGVTLAELQQGLAQIQIDTYAAWLQKEAIQYEKDMIKAYQEAAGAQKGAAEATRRIQAKESAMASFQLAAQIAGAGVAGVAIGAAAGAANLNVDMYLINSFSGDTKKAIDQSAAAQIASVNAALERRKQEWQLQKDLAEQDYRISEQQKEIAHDQVQVVTQDRTIAGIQADNDKALIEFLTTKFINPPLLEWMSDILQRVYRFFLQQATVMAKLSANQLAFERQEVPPVSIKSDYWQAPSESDTVGGTDGNAPDRRGLTGSARLLQDIYQLDQHAFDTNKRKLQLSKTISLARMAPVEFQQFIETGVMRFTTPMEMFDRGFPGHYLRLIKRVRASIIALVPPMQGIHATLSTTGPSRVVIGGEVFQTVPIRRPPELLALSAPTGSTGVVELDSQPDMLLPFEGSGVEMSWEFNMPKAANLMDYRTIADVLITLEYTALYNFDYREQVIQSLKPTVSAERPFSFRDQFADQWYDLHNPEQTKKPMTIRFRTVREDFLPNLEALKIQHVLLYFVRRNALSPEMAVSHLRYTEQGDAGTVGGSATSIEGIVSTRRGNAGSWTSMIGKSPAGEWELALPNTEEIKIRFKNEEIEDILLVVTYSGRTPAWSN